MKKIFKKSLAVALTVCMAAAMTACGGSASKPAADSAPAAEEQQCRQNDDRDHSIDIGCHWRRSVLIHETEEEQGMRQV